MATDTAVDVVMPQMGVSVSEGTITRWLKQEGEQIEQRGTSGLAAPLGKGSEVVGSVRAELENAGEQDHAVAGDCEGWLARNGE